MAAVLKRKMKFSLVMCDIHVRVLVNTLRNIASIFCLRYLNKFDSLVIFHLTAFAMFHIKSWLFTFPCLSQNYITKAYFIFVF